MPCKVPFSATENPAAPTSNALKVPPPPQGLATSRMSFSAVNSNVPTFPVRPTISSRMPAEKVVSPSMTPETTTSTIEPGGIARLATVKAAVGSTVTVPGVSSVVTPSQVLSPPDVDNSTSHTPAASLLATIPNPVNGPAKVSDAPRKLPSSSKDPFRVVEPTGESVSKPSKAPAPGQGSPSWTISGGGDGVKETEPEFPGRVTISTMIVTPNVESPAIAPDTSSCPTAPGSRMTSAAVRAAFARTHVSLASSQS